MSTDRRPLFVARRTYRHRRIADAARLLPVLGAALFLVPLLWQGGDTPEGGAGARTVNVMLYLFLAWISLAGLSALISWRLSDGEEETLRDDNA